MWKFQETDELYHYGVLGMKWGIRKAYNRGKDYTYKSHGQKKYEKRVNKLQARSDKREASGKITKFGTRNKLEYSQRRLEIYKARDKNRQNQASTSNIGKSIAKTVLFGPFGQGNYNRFRSGGHSRIVSALGSNYVAATLGYPVTFLLSRGSEFKEAKRDVRASKK